MLTVAREDELVNMMFEKADIPPACVIWSGYVIRYHGVAIALILMDGAKDAFPGSNLHYMVSGKVSHLRRMGDGFEALWRKLKADGYGDIIGVTRKDDKEALRLNRMFALKRAKFVGEGREYVVNHLDLDEEEF